jgi:acyl-CoA reductase-like NAD-dependent aldehyde dehydrogenase
MSQEVEIVFPTNACHDAFPTVLHGLQQSFRVAVTLQYRDRLAVLDELSDVLLTKRSVELGAATTVGLPFLAGFLRQTNLKTLVRRELSQPLALERFVPAGERKSLRLAPKGIVCHWIAGNVPLLGMFSWAVSALVGNVNIIRLSSRQDDLISPLLQQMADLSEAGRQMAEETVLVYFDRDNRAAHEAMSTVADVRIAWGGREAVEAIRALPCRWECEDIVLGPRVSLAVIDPTLTTDGMISRLVTDIVHFDQMACTSPQYVFVKGHPGTDSFDTFLARFVAAFNRQSRAIPRHRLDFSETYQIQLDRARILLEGGTVERDSQTQWTVVLMKHPHEKVMCANRFVQIIPFESLDFVYSHLPNNLQTVVTMLSKADGEPFTEEASQYGVCRFPRPGEGNHFETPWDSIPLVSRLTRWIVRSDSLPNIATRL